MGIEEERAYMNTIEEELQTLQERFEQVRPQLPAQKETLVKTQFSNVRSNIEALQQSEPAEQPSLRQHIDDELEELKKIVEDLRSL